MEYVAQGQSERSVRRALAASVLAPAAPSLRAAARPEKVIDVRGAHAAGGTSFEALWTAYLKAERAGDAETRGGVRARSAGCASSATC